MALRRMHPELRDANHDRVTSELAPAVCRLEFSVQLIFQSEWLSQRSAARASRAAPTVGYVSPLSSFPSAVYGPFSKLSPVRIAPMADRPASEELFDRVRSVTAHLSHPITAFRRRATPSPSEFPRSSDCGSAPALCNDPADINSTFRLLCHSSALSAVLTHSIGHCRITSMHIGPEYTRGNHSLSPASSPHDPLWITLPPPYAAPTPIDRDIV